MPASLHSTYLDWVKKSNSVENCSIVELLERMGYNKVIWLILSKNDIHLLDYSSNIDEEFIDTFRKQENHTVIKEWMENTINEQIIHFEDISRTVLYLNQDDYQHLSIIVADQVKEKKPKQIHYWVKLAVIHHNQVQKIHTLQNALRLESSSSGSLEYDKLPKITISSLKQSFLEDVVPHIFYSYVHEEFGPVIFESIPSEMKKPDHMITAVKLFSGIDAEMIADMGHVFKTDPIKLPILGDIFTIVFTLPNSDARGDFEVHAISLLIPQEFYNFSKSLIGDFKTKLFMTVEKIRILHDSKGWGLAVDPFGQSEVIRDDINLIISDLRSDTALTFALQMDPDDVVNW